MIAHWIGLHSVLLPLLIQFWSCRCAHNVAWQREAWWSVLVRQFTKKIVSHSPGAPALTTSIHTKSIIWFLRDGYNIQLKCEGWVGIGNIRRSFPYASFSPCYPANVENFKISQQEIRNNSNVTFTTARVTLLDWRFSANNRLLTHGKLWGFQLCHIMEPSGHYGINIFSFGRLFCVLSFLFSLSVGNVLILPGEEWCQWT